MKRLLALALALAGLPAAASAHPGRLDAEGCHRVHRDFTYKSGKIAKRGEQHCHRAAVGWGLVLDGREVLSERGAHGADADKASQGRAEDAAPLAP